MDLLKTAFNKVKDAYCTAPQTCNTAGMIIATGSAVGFLPYLAPPAIMILGIAALADVALHDFLKPQPLISETPKQGHERMVKMGILKP